jgi:hypothetical protein
MRLSILFVLPLLLSGVAFAADQAAPGAPFQVEDLRSGSAPAKGNGEESCSRSTIIGYPTVNGASLTAFAPGTPSWTSDASDDDDDDGIADDDDAQLDTPGVPSAPALIHGPTVVEPAAQLLPVFSGYADDSTPRAPPRYLLA